MKYFKEEKNGLEKKTLSELDRVFFTFMDINSTDDRMLIHDYIIRAIKLVCGEINSDNSKYIQIIHERYYGEPNVPHSNVQEVVTLPRKNVPKIHEEINPKHSKVKI